MIEDVSAEPIPSRARHHFNVRIPNDLALVKPLRDLISSLCRLDGFDEEKTQEVALVATELINNAIEHTTPSGVTEVRGGSFDDRLEIAVVDQAEDTLDTQDFAFEGPPDETSDRGRGLFLVQAFADDVSVDAIKGGGNRIKVLWWRNGEGESDEDGTR
jgi:anti-sigma regulatory factor (Ser/Thr protein kinase)